MTTLFISDLHLCKSYPQITAIFLRFLENEARNCDALYILGDLFEAWIGDDDETTFNLSILHALRTLTHTGIPVYFMHGNRDFLIGKKFQRLTGCQLLSDPTLLTLYGVPTLLMHGDLLCIEDVAYQKFRAKTRKWWVQKLFLWRSLTYRRAIAQQLRDASQQHARLKSESIMDATPSEIVRIIEKYKVQRLIHGHTHRPVIEKISLENRTAERVVLAPWEALGNVLLCTPEGKIAFKELL